MGEEAAGEGERCARQKVGVIERRRSEPVMKYVVIREKYGGYKTFDTDFHLFFVFVLLLVFCFVFLFVFCLLFLVWVLCMGMGGGGRGGGKRGVQKSCCGEPLDSE